MVKQVDEPVKRWGFNFVFVESESKFDVLFRRLYMFILVLCNGGNHTLVL